MALRGTLTHRKTRRLARLLDYPLPCALGIVEALWHVCAELAPAGDIGRLSNADIADEMFFSVERADELIDALVDAEFIERNATHRLIIHDWHVHSDDATDNKLARHGERYASGHLPRMRRLSKAERAKAVETFAAAPPTTKPQQSVRTDSHNGAQRTTESHYRSPEPVPEPEPDSLPNGSCRSDERLDEFADAWNRLRGPLPRIIAMNDERKRKVRIRVKHGMKLPAFEEAVRRCASTPFLMGANNRGWQANFDWLIENDTNLAKVLEGAYSGTARDAPVAADVPQGAWSDEAVARRRAAEEQETAKAYAAWKSMSPAFRKSNPWQGPIPEAPRPMSRAAQNVSGNKAAFRAAAERLRGSTSAEPAGADGDGGFLRAPELLAPVQ